MTHGFALKDPVPGVHLVAIFLIGGVVRVHLRDGVIRSIRPFVPGDVPKKSAYFLLLEPPRSRPKEANAGSRSAQATDPVATVPLHIVIIRQLRPFGQILRSENSNTQLPEDLHLPRHAVGLAGVVDEPAHAGFSSRVDDVPPMEVHHIEV
eukprot:CAMPEP_0198230810 /NCGR_PEP_ID=MMETSP1445-20131203/114868_1 /TAXON_ID=36898 /ORGANISM="Pyramimonas sp., Strain CCMP2087" /LENGTH=150 /DNA_ID=CAMNT_0043911389 /DNA_START=870 /DNA_END=1322 /DNA_ORIENTATION=+